MRDARRGIYGEFVASVRQYRLHVAGPDARIEVWTHPDGSRLVPGIGTEGASYQERMEAAFTEVQMVAPDQETVDKAHLLTSIARRLAIARAVHGARQYGDLDESLFEAERDFLNCVRHDLGLVDLKAVPFPDALAQIDASLLAAYCDQIPGPAAE